MLYCQKCGNRLSETAEFCPECGTKVVEEEPKAVERVIVKEVKERKSHPILKFFSYLLLVIVILAVIGGIIAGVIFVLEEKSQGHAVEPVCREEVVNAKGCDQMEGCSCIHESWGGLGSCDTCKCIKCF